MIQVKKLTVQYGPTPLLNQISFDVQAGEIVAVVGPSGSGKSTLLRCLCGLEIAQSGEILIDGQSIQFHDFEGLLTSPHYPIGVVFQGFNLFPHLSVLQNLTYAPVCKSLMTRTAAEEKAEKLLTQAGLEGRGGHFPKTLSGGEKQRVAILRALMMDPKLLLLDEPTSALDPNRTEALALLMQELARTGMTVLMVTHDMQFVEQSKAKILELSAGRLTLR